MDNGGLTEATSDGLSELLNHGWTLLKRAKSQVG